MEDISSKLGSLSIQGSSTSSGQNLNPQPDPRNDPTFLFEVTVTNSDSLPMPYAVARPHVPVSTTTALAEMPLLLTDQTNHLWSVENGRPLLTYVHFDAERAYIVIRDWPAYVAKFRLRPGDKILFFRPVPRLGSTHFRTQNIHQLVITPPLPIVFPIKDFIVEMKISPFEAVGERMVVDYDWGDINFPVLAFRPGNQEMVRFTDYRGKDWYMTILYMHELKAYMLMNGWSNFVKEHRLRSGDLVRIFNTNFDVSHEKHFLIQFGSSGNAMVGDSGERPEGSEQQRGGKAKRMRCML